MKAFYLLLSVLTILTATLTGCGDKERNQTVTIVKDCTGVYLQLDGKDYEVCNREKVDFFPDGAIVTATFEELIVCDDFRGDFVCAMYHPREGLVKVHRIK